MSLDNTKLVQAEVTVETPHLLVVKIRTYDVESSRGSGGTGEDAAFALLLYDSQRVSSIDATIALKNRKNIRRGNGVYNDTGSGQTLSQRMKSTDPFRFLVAVHHEGNSPESLLLRAGASGGKTVVWYSRMNGTRTNLTALIRSGNLFSSDFRPGEHILIEGNVIPKRGGKSRRSAGWIRSTLAAPDSPADQVGWSLSTPPRKRKP